MSNNTRPQNCSSLGPVQIVNGTVKSAQNDGVRLFWEFAEAMDTWETKFVGKCPMAKFETYESANL